MPQQTRTPSHRLPVKILAAAPLHAAEVRDAVLSDSEMLPLFDQTVLADFGHGESHQAPKNYLAIAENMNAACRAIAAMWDSAKPPGAGGK